MAKVRAPLFSFGASGAIGEALVYFNWKGLNVVRSYVVPANPNTTAQDTQRGYLEDAVDAVHAAQILADHPLDASDIVALALLGSCEATPRTWFNTIVKQWIDQKVDSKLPAILRGTEISNQPDGINATFHADAIENGSINAGTVYYGTSKTALIHTWPAIFDGSPTVARVVITGLVTDTKYFLQFRASSTANYNQNRSGIYSGVPD